ncbi:DUF3313 domain-containing protein [Iodobacter fluviatilis]|uniref:Protein of uncharacterized function (DUF3313) n=1 Tax=Iodobacter fluviatilis TaxID=537 RepID=A0A377Q7D4_9NEIS|nr:DUF3313 domain-containing protein [Iodobacter fluviatilis]TCU89392.1 uncharacterized protein DUF3313 [Iodobacter fluviatilis]STQ90762.1 Protein of uncharacterised function (DUF3313) [Iodobacter fluviatilis]
MKTNLIHALVLAVTLTVPAFASEEIQPENLFTVPLSAFKPSDKDASRRLYVQPGISLKDYNAVLIEPLYFMRHSEESNWQLLQGSEENKIAEYFHKKMTGELRKAGIAVVQEAGPGVAKMRVAITGLAQERPGIDVIDVLPAKAVINLARLAAGKEPYLMKIGNIAQLEDSQSGSLLAGSVNLRKSTKTVQKDEPMQLKTIEKLIDKWCHESADLLVHAMTISHSAKN